MTRGYPWWIDKNEGMMIRRLDELFDHNVKVATGLKGLVLWGKVESTTGRLVAHADVPGLEVLTLMQDPDGTLGHARITDVGLGGAEEGRTYATALLKGIDGKETDDGLAIIELYLDTADRGILGGGGGGGKGEKERGIPGEEDVTEGGMIDALTLDNMALAGPGRVGPVGTVDKRVDGIEVLDVLRGGPLNTDRALFRGSGGRSGGKGGHIEKGGGGEGV